MTAAHGTLFPVARPIVQCIPLSLSLYALRPLPPARRSPLPAPSSLQRSRPPLVRIALLHFPPGRLPALKRAVVIGQHADAHPGFGRRPHRRVRRAADPPLRAPARNSAPAARFETELQQDADVIGKAFISVSEVGALHLGQRRIAGEVDGEPLHIFILVIGLIGFWPVRRGATGRFRNDEAG